MDDSNLLGFGNFLTIAIVSLILVLSVVSAKKAKQQNSSTSAQDPAQLRQQVRELQKQCAVLQERLQQPQEQFASDFQNKTFEQLQTLLIYYPTAVKLAESKPNLPASSVTALFTALENLLQSWGIEAIGTPWEKVAYTPQLHQPDTHDLKEGELVYIRFVGYQQGKRILCPAKVSRTLPEGI